MKEIKGIQFEEITKFKCRNCGASDVDYIYITGNKAIKAQCKCCGTYIKFVKQLNAPKYPATEKQIAFAKKISLWSKTDVPDFSDFVATSKYIKNFVDKNAKSK